MSQFRQLPLKFEVREVFTFNTFVSGDNAVSTGIVQQCATGSGEKQVYLWSVQGGGKSHLLQAACNLASKSDRSVCYLPANEIIQVSPQVFDGLEQLDLVCIDDVHRLMQSRDWEVALFDLINRMRESGNSLILAATTSPEASQVELPDLRSRLSWGPVFQLQSLSDTEKFEALRIRANLGGLELPENVAEYLMRHYPRDLFGLFEKLEALDTASMAMQRKLTIPFIKSVLDK